jgi:glycosyltransferase involved in cell wall biosynthesis
MISVLYITPKLPNGDTEISYSFVKEELNEVKKIGDIRAYILEIDYERPFGIIRKISKFVSFSNSFKVVHAHFAVPYGYLATIIAKLGRKSLVVTVHGFDVLVYKELSYGLNRFKLIKPFTKYVLRTADKVIANSKYLRNECVGYGVHPSKITVIPLGVNLHTFRPMKYEDIEDKLPSKLKEPKIKNNNCIWILCAKSLEKIYGIEYLLKSAKILKNRTNNNFMLILLGGSMFKDYFELVHRLGLAKNVIFLGTLPRTVMPLLYSISDFTVVPSLVEGFGLVVAESLACGRPVVGSHVGGIMDQIIDGYNGYLVPPKDPLLLANRMQILIEDESIRKEMSRNARIYAEAKLDIRKRVNRLLEIYHQLAEEVE